jgi:hypothetical protein
MLERVLERTWACILAQPNCYYAAVEGVGYQKQQHSTASTWLMTRQAADLEIMVYISTNELRLCELRQAT